MIVLDNKDVMNGSKVDDKMSITRLKKLKLSAIQKLIKDNPVFPLMGDIHITSSAVIRLAPHLDSTRWEPESEDEKRAAHAHYSVTQKLPTFQADFEAYVAELSLMKILVGACPRECRHHPSLSAAHARAT